MASDKNKNKITYMLSMPEDIWYKFKSKITKDKTINGVILDLIKEFLRKNGENIDDYG
jgi:hypothetical protein